LFPLFAAGTLSIIRLAYYERSARLVAELLEAEEHVLNLRQSREAFCD
jgi:hypothetical protein